MAVAAAMPETLPSTRAQTPAMPLRFGATILQVVPFPQLRDDFVFAEPIGLDDA